jgi:hypothetical protein
MTPLDRYRWVLLNVTKWFSVALMIAATIIALCIIFDLEGRAGWGYPWYALPVTVVILLAGIGIRRAATTALRSFGP